MSTLNSLTRSSKVARASTRVGRGGRRGKTSGRGTKGQKARAGHSLRPELRDIIKKYPKRRGYGKNRARTVNDARIVSSPVSIGKIEEVFAAGETVSPKTLVEKGVLTARGKKYPDVVIVANGTLAKKVAVEGARVTKGAKAAIEAAGGTVSK